MRRLALGVQMVLIGGCATMGLRPSGPTGTRPVIADQKFLEQYAVTRGFSLGRPTSIQIVPDGSAVLFLRSLPRSPVQDLYEFDATTGEERVLLTAETILAGAEEQLSVEERARRERLRMTARGIAAYQLSKDGFKILVPLSGRLFVIHRNDHKVMELKSEQGFPIDPKFSPDGKYVSCVRDGEVYVTELGTGVDVQLTTGAGGPVTNGLAEFVAQEEMDRHSGYWWSPDSAMIAYQQTDTTGMETMHIMDAMYPDRPPQTWPYPRPGKVNAKVRLGVIPASGGETTWVSWDGDKYEYLAKVTWDEHSPLTVLLQNRAQTEELLGVVDPRTGSISELLTEKDEAWINLDPKMPHWLPDGSGFFWTTERHGIPQLELRDKSGKLTVTVTGEDFPLQELVSYDPQQRAAYVLASNDPTQKHVYRVALDGVTRTPRRLTLERGQHSAVFSRNHAIYVHTAATAEGERWHSVRRREGGEIGRLQSVTEAPPFLPNLELTSVGRDPGFHCAIVRPRNFDAAHRYPIIVSVYGGPGAQTVSASSYRYLFHQWFADHGFIVVSMDGRGTPNRGRDWERIIKGDIIDVPLKDQASALQMLGKKYAEMDLSRVGIYGWSFGGYFSAMAVMRRPDVFHCGVAGAPVCDWLDYDTHYTERFMGLPDENAKGYEAASVLTYCKDMKRRLLIIHGTADDNVYFAHGLKMSNALFRAGKQHDFLALSGFTHMVAEPLVTTELYTRIVGFFVEHLGP